jgi:hypothetical protein
MQPAAAIASSDRDQEEGGVGRKEKKKKKKRREEGWEIEGLPHQVYKDCLPDLESFSKFTNLGISNPGPLSIYSIVLLQIKILLTVVMH